MVPVQPSRQRFVLTPGFTFPGRLFEGWKILPEASRNAKPAIGMKSLRSLIQKSETPKEEVVQYWREKIFNTLSLLFLGIGTLILIPTILAAVAKGYWGVIVLELAAYATLLFNFFFQRVSFSIRTWNFFVMLFFLGTGVEILLGPYGSGLICLFMIPILAAILHGFRSAILAIVLNTLAFITIGILLQLKVLTHTHLNIYDLTGWTIVSLNFASVSMVITLSVAFIVHRIEQGLLREKQMMAEKQAETDKLLKVNAELDRFVYSASHDLRAPLTSLQGLINIFQLEKDEQQREELMKMMGQRVDKMNGFIGQIIHYSWNSRVEVHCEKIDFHSLMAQVLDNLQFNEGYQETQLHLSIKGNAVFSSDEKRIGLIFNNLLSNSFRYRNPYIRPEIRIEIEKADHEAVIRITDNGLGIREEHLPHVTKMFYRATEKNAGSGLGLFIVKETLDTLQGDVRISSRLNQGTTVEVILPNLVVQS